MAGKETSDVLDFLNAAGGEVSAALRRWPELEVNRMYLLERVEATAHPDFGRSIRVFYRDADVLCFSYLPRKYRFMTDNQVEHLNQEIQDRKPPAVSYHGQVGQANLVRIYRYGSYQQPLNARSQSPSEVDQINLDETVINAVVENPPSSCSRGKRKRSAEGEMSGSQQGTGEKRKKE